MTFSLFECDFFHRKYIPVALRQRPNLAVEQKLKHIPDGASQTYRLQMWVAIAASWRTSPWRAQYPPADCPDGQIIVPDSVGFSTEGVFPILCMRNKGLTKSSRCDGIITDISIVPLRLCEYTDFSICDGNTYFGSRSESDASNFPAVESRPPINTQTSWIEVTRSDQKRWLSGKGRDKGASEMKPK
jgi:hypothetical protein